MSSFAQAIRSFHSGGLSSNELFAQVDRAVSADRRQVERLLKILQEEHTHYPLPPQVYAEVERRIVGGNGAGGEASEVDGEETRVRTLPLMRDGTTPGAGDDAPAKGVGDVLNGRFELEECLGFGGMGMVYKALDRRKLEASDRNPYIAIKVLNVQFRGHPKSLIALQREAKKAQKLAHPNIVTVYDFDRDGDVVYLTMELLSGHPLSHLLRSPDFRGLPFAKALPIISGMARALAYAHERGFVHCDLKPANVFLTDSGEVKVIDFGIARVFQKPETDTEATVFDPGSLGGMTPAYASPEMLDHLEPDPRDDIYALGCISYELLTGRHPFERKTAIQARAAKLRPPRPKGLAARPWRAIRGALSLDRETRTPSVARFLQDLGGQRKYALPLALAAGLALLSISAAVLLIMRGPAMVERPSATTEAPPLSLAAVTPVLANVPCSALVPSLQGGKLKVRGYLAQSYGEPRLRQALETVPGAQGAALDVQLLEEAQCGVVQALAPYWSRNQTAQSDRTGGGATIRTQAAGGQLTEGDALVVKVTTPGYDAYVYIDYYSLDGKVVHLVPSLRVKGNQAPPNYSATVGGAGDWVISKPFGQELIVLLITPTPLFDGRRPEIEPADDYLKVLTQQLGAVAAGQEGQKVVADWMQINTRPR